MIGHFTLKQRFWINLIANLFIFSGQLYFLRRLGFLGSFGMLVLTGTAFFSFAITLVFPAVYWQMLAGEEAGEIPALRGLAKRFGRITGIALLVPAVIGMLFVIWEFISGNNPLRHTQLEPVLPLLTGGFLAQGIRMLFAHYEIELFAHGESYITAAYDLAILLFIVFFLRFISYYVLFLTLSGVGVAFLCRGLIVRYYAGGPELSLTNELFLARGRLIRHLRDMVIATLIVIASGVALYYYQRSLSVPRAPLVLAVPLAVAGSLLFGWVAASLRPIFALGLIGKDSGFRKTSYEISLALRALATLAGITVLIGVFYARAEALYNKETFVLLLGSALCLLAGGSALTNRFYNQTYGFFRFPKWVRLVEITLLALVVGITHLSGGAEAAVPALIITAPLAELLTRMFFEAWILIYSEFNSAGLGRAFLVNCKTTGIVFLGAVAAVAALTVPAELTSALRISLAAGAFVMTCGVLVVLNFGTLKKIKAHYGLLLENSLL